jgi:integrase
MPSFLLTDRAVGALPQHPAKQVDYRDTEVRGFFVRVGARRKTYMIQGDLRKDGKRFSVKLAIGPAGEFTAREARARAKTLLGMIQQGIHPNPKAAMHDTRNVQGRGPTLRTAWKNYLQSHLIRKGRSQKTVNNYADHVERLLKDWLDVPLEVLGNDPELVKAKHDLITEDNGPYMANGCMRTYRAIYRHARKTARHLPFENPVSGVDWNREKRRNSGMGAADIKGWFADLAHIENPLRRELHLLMLLSGSRPDPMRKIDLKHIDLRGRALFVPTPKGGEEKAFCIPLSRQMICAIIRAIRLGRIMYPKRRDGWLFPADSASGHIVEYKEDRSTLAHWGNDLRQTYRTIGQAIGISPLDMHLLMNHSVPDINSGYITRSKLQAHLLGIQQQISDFLLEVAARKPGQWPLVPSRSLFAPVRISTSGWDEE